MAIYARACTRPFAAGPHKFAADPHKFAADPHKFAAASTA